MILPFKGKHPKIGKNVFIAPGAVIVGNVTIGDGSSIWFNTVIRGDSDAVVIGENTNIQDNCTIHVDEGKPCVIGDHVTIGHNAVVHGCRIEDVCLIGINATVLNGAVIRKGSIVGSNAVVMENQNVGPGHLVTGVPAKLKKEMPEDMLAVVKIPADIYVRKSMDYAEIIPAGE